MLLMSNSLYVEFFFVYLLVIAIPFMCFFMSKKILKKVRYTGIVKQNLIFLIASIICLLFFIIYFSVFVSIFDLSIKWLNYLYFVLVPVSFLSMVFFLLRFLSSKNGKTPDRSDMSK